jgi:hypothetical protein
MSLVRSEKCGIFYHVTGIGQSNQRTNLPGIAAEEPLQLRLFSLSDEPGESRSMPSRIVRKHGTVFSIESLSHVADR